MKKGFVVFAIACMFVGMPSQSDAQVGVRVGLSSMTGLAGLEYRTGNISLGAGPLLDGQIAVSGRYALNAEGNSLWGGLAFVINRGEAIVKKGDSFKKFSQVGPVVGYRMGLNESLDLSLGGGYGVYLGVDKEYATYDDNLNAIMVENDTAGVLIDFSLGYSF